MLASVVLLGAVGLMALCAEMCGAVCGLLVSVGDLCKRSRSISMLLFDLKRREMLDVWDSRTASQYQQVHSE
jgi:hypothetical protein